MIKISVMYPNSPDAHFDADYYCAKHMPMVQRLMGDYCKSYAVDRALPGARPETNAPYIAMGHLFCESLADFEAGFGPHAKEIMADIPNYTGQTPIIQYSEVLAG